MSSQYNGEFPLSRLAWDQWRQVMESPLVNGYKRNFILRRLLETLTGGLRIYLPHSAPLHVYIIQICLYVVVPVCCSLFIHLCMTKSLELVHASLANGITLFLYAFCLQLLAHFLKKNATGAEKGDEVFDASDEETVVFDSVFGSKTWLFIIPPKRFSLNIILHSIVFGSVGGLAVYYLQAETTSSFYSSKNIQVAVIALGLIAVTAGLWPLVVGSPPEPAIFHQLSYDISALSRPCHLCIFMMFYFLSSHNPGSVWLLYANRVTLVMFICCPLLWLFGVLPPIDALFLWVLERWLILGLGGSATCNNLGLVVQCLLGTGSLCVMPLLPGFPSCAIFAALRGYILSLDLCTFTNSWWWRRNTKIETSFAMSSFTSRKKEDCVSVKLICKKTLFFGAVFFAILAVSVAVHLSPVMWYDDANSKGYDKETQKPVFFQVQTQNILGYGLITVALSLLLANSLQKIYFFSVFKNPFFSRTGAKMMGAFYYLSQSIHLGGPFISLLFMDSLNGAEYKSVLRTTFLESFLLMIPFAFCYRQAWQFPSRNIIHQAIFFLLQLILRELLQKLTPWSAMPPSLRLHLLILACIWLWNVFEKLKTVSVISITSVTEPRVRKTVNLALVGMNIIFSGFIFILVVASSVFFFPLLPLFTLPLFLLGFPRTQRFWSYPVGFSANRCPDSVYYEQLSPSVLEQVHKSILSGRLGVVETGDFFMLRWEDRFIWMQVLECGYAYYIYSIKGLELQETSCHTAEASCVDSIFSKAFDIKRDSFINPYPLHSLTPVTTVKAVCYSDTKNVLTGVIESPETLGAIKDYFLKAVLYFIVESASVRQKNSAPQMNGSPCAMPPAKKEDDLDFIQVAEETSVSSHSGGRGSRMAWTTNDHIGESRDKKSKDSFRPFSWNDEEDPLEFRRQIPSEKSASKRERGSNDLHLGSDASRSVFPPISSKAKTYVPTKDHLADVGNVKSLPGKMYDSSSDSETETTTEVLDPLEYKSSAKINLRVLSGKMAHPQSYRTSLSSSLVPPEAWLVEIPYEEEELEDIQDNFPLSWFKFVLGHFGRLKYDQLLLDQKKEGIASDRDHAMRELTGDDILEESYRMLAASCQIITFGNDFGHPSPSHVYKVFSGELPWSTGLDWLATREDLSDLLIKTFRISVKLSLDHALFGPMNGGWMELQESLKEYSSLWHIGPDSPLHNKWQNQLRSSAASRKQDLCQWEDAVRKQTPSLFSLGYDDTKNVYTSHLLTLTEAELFVGKLDSETVLALWSSLVAELLYLTNDDDERYSIQAHPVILRNLTIQAADPPLGYPIYASPASRRGLLWLESR